MILRVYGTVFGKEMALGFTKLWKWHSNFRSFAFPVLSVRSVSSFKSFEAAVLTAVQTKNFAQIPDLFESRKELQNRNPFSFLSSFSHDYRTRIIDEMLQALIPIRPRSRAKIVYSFLLSHTLQSSHPFPVSLAILQRILRSGCLPDLQIHLLLSNAWLSRRQQSHPVSDVLFEMKSIGYNPDLGSCNYLISSLCAVDQLDEATRVLKGMAAAGCMPDLESYGSVINSMCLVRKTSAALEMVKQMVGKTGLWPRQGTVAKVAAALRANREIWKAVEMIEFLENEGYPVEFESYELVTEGCLECREYVLARKVVMKMTDRGFIPYIKVRQKVVEGLAGIGEWKLACSIRQRFADMRS